VPCIALLGPYLSVLFCSHSRCGDRLSTTSPQLDGIAHLLLAPFFSSFGPQKNPLKISLALLTQPMSTSLTTRKMAILDKHLASMEEKGLRVLIFNQINRIQDILESYRIFQHYSEVCPIIVFSPAINPPMGSYPIIRNTAVLTVRLHTITISA